MHIAPFEAIGTSWEIEYATPNTRRISHLEDRIHARIEEFDKAYSRFRTDSLVTLMARAGGTHNLPADGYALLTFYHKLYNVTKGKITPLIGKVMEDAGYDANYSLVSGELTTPKLWDAVIAYDKESITLHEPAVLDFGAAGKGYLVDCIGDLLKEHGVNAFCINAGGDMLCFGDETQRIGLENPQDAKQVLGIAELATGSICGSSGNRRAWGAYHHIIDPKTLESPRHVLATWVVAEQALVADGIATSLYMVEPEVLTPVFDFAYAVLKQDGTMQASPHFPATFFT